MYMFILSIVPEIYAKYFIPILVFLDPTIIGFFFIGGILMLEKQQGIIQYMLVTPLRIEEYIISKIISLTSVAIFAGLAITITSGYKGRIDYKVLISGIILMSILFILIGILTSIGCKSLNDYIVRMIPVTIILILPCMSIPFNQVPKLLRSFPTALGLKLVLSAFNAYPMGISYMYVIVSLCVIDVLLFLLTSRIYTRVLSNGGM